MQTQEKLQARWAMLLAKHATHHENLMRQLAETARRERGQAVLDKIARKARS